MKPQLKSRMINLVKILGIKQIYSGFYSRQNYQIFSIMNDYLKDAKLYMKNHRIESDRGTKMVSCKVLLMNSGGYLKGPECLSTSNYSDFQRYFHHI